MVACSVVERSRRLFDPAPEIPCRTIRTCTARVPGRVILGRLLDHDLAENNQTRSEHTIVAENLLGPLDHYVQER
jgi:hypothetical protein